MTRAECIAELRARRDACQRTAEIHPCELARARSEGRAQAYRHAAQFAGRLAGDELVRRLRDARYQGGRGNVGRAQDQAYANALELVGQIAGEP